MRVKMQIIHVQSGSRWTGDASDLTEDELVLMQDSVRGSLKHVNYIELDGTILPGDFIRQQCVITFIVDRTPEPPKRALVGVISI